MRARKARSRNTETRDAEDARRADDFNGRQSMIIRKPNGDAVTQRPCPNLRYCSSGPEADTAERARVRTATLTDRPNNDVQQKDSGASATPHQIPGPRSTQKQTTLLLHHLTGRYC